MKKFTLLIGFLLIWQTWAVADVIIIDNDYDFETGGLYYQVTDFKEHYITVLGYSTNETRIVIPDKVVYGNVEYIVTTIGDQSFRDNNELISVEIPNTITCIESNAFRHCIKLETVTIPNSVKKIGLGPFSECRSLTAINIEDGNSDYVSVDGVVYNTAMTKIVQYPANKSDTTFVIPNTVEIIEYGAFSNCKNLVSISIPNSVRSIEWWSFPGCGSLRYVEVPSSVTHIGQGAFSYCRKMEAIFIPKSVTTIEDRAFFTCPKLKIYCEAESQPEDWVDNYDSETVIWKSKRSKFQKTINNK